MQIALIVVAGLIAWAITGFANYHLYGRLFPDSPKGMDRDLLVGLGPIGTVMVALLAFVMAYLWLTKAAAARLDKVNSLVLIFAAVVPWLGSGAANYVWHGRLFKDAPKDGMDRDFLALLGPIGSFMLLLCAALQGFLNLCAALGKRQSA